jgi:hypothetical protein
MTKEKGTKKSRRGLSLAPLKFDKALSNILKVKLELEAKSGKGEKPEKEAR